MRERRGDRSEPLTSAAWRKSGCGGSTGGECVEVADGRAASVPVPVHDSREPAGPCSPWAPTPGSPSRTGCADPARSRCGPPCAPMLLELPHRAAPLAGLPQERGDAPKDLFPQTMARSRRSRPTGLP
ncbi:DUF397 domain-containing protein [Streptomyces sp. NPDC056796]|uniref:DUF397 domain-containing protein n=1 Tax=Streptomyces sp. NPDC056796 TaxID=3345947 RepID=UPI0036994757